MRIINILKEILLSLIQGKAKNIKDSNNLLGKTVVITGAGRGIGMATAKVLGGEGANLVLISRNLNGLKKNFEKFDSKKTLLIDADVTNEKQVKNAVKKAIAKFGEIDVLVNNAGVNIHSYLEDVNFQEAEKLLKTNILGPFLMCKYIIPVMKKQKSGTIINIGSKISRNTNVLPKKALYAASKYAVEGFSYALNKELKKSKIRVTCLLPGTVNTFVSKSAARYLSPYRVGEIISMIIRFDDVDFENFVIKSVHQDI